MAEKTYIPKDAGFKTVGAQGSGKWTKRAELSSYTPDVVKATGGTSAGKGLEPLIVGSVGKMSQWEKGNEFIGKQK